MPQNLPFKAICLLHRDAVYRYARYILGNGSDAEDVTQEVFLRYWRNFAKVDFFRIKAWLLSTTRNLCLDDLRRRKRHNLEPLPENTGSTELSETEPGPLAKTEAALFMEDLEKALLLLPEKQRSIFILHEINGLRCRQIAGILDMPLSSVKVYLSRARNRLQEILIDHQPETRKPQNENVTQATGA